MISAICWVPKGVAKAEPIVADPPSKEEIEEIIKTGALDTGGDSENEENNDGMDVETKKQGDEVAQALTVADAIGKISAEKSDDIAIALRELNMENYDDEDEGVELFRSELYYPSNEMDPYLKDKQDDDSEDLEDMIISPADAVIVCAKHEDDVSSLEVWILEDYNSNKYVHHDVMIPAFPLCTAWLDCPLKGGEKGNFIAVGSMDPAIEIWDLDVIDEVQPSVVLGGIAEKKKKGKKKSIKYKDDSHTDSVLGLAWNKDYRNILASASADKRVKIWDVAAGKCDVTMEHHSDKVQAVAWNHHAPQVLLSGSFDHTIVMRDGRMPTHSGYKWTVTADVESLAWDPHTEHSFVVSLEDGTVKGFDVRTAKSDSMSEQRSTFTLHAHEKAVTSVSYNPSAANLLATGSMDKTVKLWDLTNNQPSCVSSKNSKVGAIFSVSFSGDSPFLLAMGGSKGVLEVWDTLSEAGISRKYGNYNKKAPESEF